MVWKRVADGQVGLFLELPVGAATLLPGLSASRAGFHFAHFGAQFWTERLVLFHQTQQNFF